MISGFDHRIFEEEDSGGTREGLDGCTYLNPRYWVKQMEKMNESAGIKNLITVSGLKKRLVCPFRSQ